MSGTLTRGSTAAPLRMEVPAEVPFLVNNKEKWISGIVEETTCGDVVKALLAAEGRLRGCNEEHLDKFVMVERWSKVGLHKENVKIYFLLFQVERPLKCDFCLLKIWHAWGPDAKDV